ncbi:zona pellucida sperm-binding protein 3-like isoform X2 [Notolabrus celidotus]|uniref:zona pellucida sperm-binding protein 3-like isoform X2 n=1 Tax=Notolabrus celidotus TaxID=1203425 RepID=UPI00148F8FD4|nr:zona pellucida sperm-binding protein 3-like isoform X2 [Notolabrus celidotus]
MPLFLLTASYCPQQMKAREQTVIFLSLLSGFLSVSGALNDGERENRDSPGGAGLVVRCGEVNVMISVKRQFFEDRRIPFRPEFLRLGATKTQQRSCEPTVSEHEMVISAGLQDCGTKAHPEGFVFSNQLFLIPPVTPVSTGTEIVRGMSTVIPVECHYKRKQTVRGEPITPTWQPMTSTISAFGLLHFSLHTMEEDCSSLRSSSEYQQGEAVFLEAGVEAPLHPPLTLYVDSCVATLKPDPLSLPSYTFITKHGCLMDSVLPGSSSKILPREQNNRLCFSVQVPRFNQESGDQLFITCHLKVTLTPNSPSHLDKACFFHGPTFRWRSADRDDAFCECCESDNCLRYTEGGNSGTTGHRPPPNTGRRHEVDATVGPLLTLQQSHWTGRLSVGP